jgi:hypothetical protein
VRRGTGSDRQLRAFHEAGHVVATWRLKLPVPGASLIRQFCAPSLDSLTTLEGVTQAELLERRALALMAGVAAESYLTQDEDWWGAPEDRQAVERLIAELIELGQPPSPRDEAEANLVAAHEHDAQSLGWRLFTWRTHQMMALPPIRSAVATLATELLSRGSLSPAEVAKSIRRGVAGADPDLLMG